VGELIEAAMLIRKRNDESSLKLAALIADKAGAQDLASMLANQSMKQSLLVGKLDVAGEVAHQHAHLKVREHHQVSDVQLQGYIQKFLDWLPGARTANGIAFCESV